MSRPELRPWLTRIEPYRAGRQSFTAAGSLASNESAVGASPAVTAAITAAAASVHRYPDPLATGLRRDLAEHHGVHPDQILVGNGSDELIYLLAWAYLAQSGTAVCADPPYRMDEISTYVVGAKVRRVPLRAWAHDLEAMAAAGGDIAYIVNPHNPTGTTCSREAVEWFVEHSGACLVVVDEAYIDFADDPEELTAMAFAATGRAIVLRTFSKAYGLAGARIGYLVGPLEVVEALRRIRAPFSVSAIAQAAAVAALGDRKHLAEVVDQTRARRVELVGVLNAAGYAVVPSQANFVLVVAPDEDGLLAALRAGGVSARAGSSLGIPGAVRITVPGAAGLAMLSAALGVGPELSVSSEDGEPAVASTCSPRGSALGPPSCLLRTDK